MKTTILSKRLKEIFSNSIHIENKNTFNNLIIFRRKNGFKKSINIIENANIEDRKSNFSVKSLKLKNLIFLVIILIVFIISNLAFLNSYLDNFFNSSIDIINKVDKNLWKFILIGFIAQMIDGSLGMAYGVSVTTMLMSIGLPSITPAIASASMHCSEIFTSGSSSLLYLKYKNINRKLFKSLLWPGIIGAIAGVLTVSYISKDYFSFLKPFVAIYTLVLGLIIFLKAFKRSLSNGKVKNIYSIAFFGGFLDSVGGGGWGPIVSSSLLVKGRNIKYTVGSAHLAKFFVALGSTITFIFCIGLNHWQVIFGLIIGGIIASPFSIYLSNKISNRNGLILVSLLIIIISFKTLIKSIGL